MSNVSFGGIELSAYGFALIGLDGRGMADFAPTKVEIPGQSVPADVAPQFATGSSTVLAGFLSADTENYPAYTHEEFLARLDALKNAINPLKGFQKLVITGDQPDRWRWARFQAMQLTERKPIFRLPFQEIGISFENYEPFWREAAPLAIASTVPYTIPNNDVAHTTPIFQIAVGTNIVATAGAIPQGVVLCQVDDFTIIWKGTASETGGTLIAGELLTVNSSAMTVTRQSGGVGTPSDAIRFYDYGGAGGYKSRGFPMIQPGGSVISVIHANVANVTVRYDYLYL